jgi:hypothetical protein
MERTGWLVQLPIIGGFNEPLLMRRAIALALRARLGPPRRLHDLFLLAHPLLIQGGELLALNRSATCPIDSLYSWSHADERLLA